jgi:hypothetical protein
VVRKIATLPAAAAAIASTSFTPRLVQFIITWYDETAGVYTGSIDSDGFVSGIARDRFSAGSKATWDMTTRALRVMDALQPGGGRAATGRPSRVRAASADPTTASPRRRRRACAWRP